MARSNKEDNTKYNKEYHSKHREHLNSLKKQYYIDNKEKLKTKHREYNVSHSEAMQKYRDEHKDEQKNRQLMRNYGITIDKYNSMLIAQDNRCIICNNKFKNSRSTHVDHDHKNNKVRDLLCTKCNTTIGLVNEDICILQRAIDYLKKWK